MVKKEVDVIVHSRKQSTAFNLHPKTKGGVESVGGENSFAIHIGLILGI